MRKKGEVMRIVMLTTQDNPFNPITNFDEWYTYDLRMGHDTCGVLARLCPAPSDVLPDEYISALKEQKIDELCNLFPKMYKKVTAEED